MLRRYKVNSGRSVKMFYNNPEKREWRLDQHDDVETKTGLVDEPTVGHERKRSTKNDSKFWLVVLFGLV